MKDDYIRVEKAAELEAKIKLYISIAEYEENKIKAERFEFKNNDKKALDVYQNILFALTHDDVDDALQRGLIDEVEAKIRFLQEELISSNHQ